MKSFRSLIVVKRPRPLLWAAMRDHLTDFAGSIADIEAIRELSRTIDANGLVHIENAWTVRQQVPAMLRPIVGAGVLGWIDRNTWDANASTCTWTIEPKFLTEHVACSGQTTFADAMAAQGTRVTFEGTLELKPGLLGSLGGMEALLAGFIESIVTTIIPRNLRAVVEAAAIYRFSPDQDAMMKSQPRICQR